MDKNVKNKSKNAQKQGHKFEHIYRSDEKSKKKILNASMSDDLKNKYNIIKLSYRGNRK